MKRFAPACAFIYCLAAWASPAQAVPQDGVYAQTANGLFENFETVADSGILQIDYVPSMSRFNTSGSMQVLQAAARYPAPLIDSGFKLSGLLGYQEQWAYYDGLEDTDGGVDLGLSSSLALSSLPWIGDFFSPFTLYAYGFINQLILAKANGQGFSPMSATLPSYGVGASVKVPTGGSVYLGLETFSLPQTLGSGKAQAANGINSYNDYVLGYRW